MGIRTAGGKGCHLLCPYLVGMVLMVLFSGEGGTVGEGMIVMEGSIGSFNCHYSLEFRLTVLFHHHQHNLA